MFNILKSVEQITEEEIQATKRLLSDIVNHARQESRQFTLNDLIEYKNRFIQLINSRYYSTSILVGELSGDVRCMSHLIQIIIDVQKQLNSESLSADMRSWLTDYKETYYNLHNDY